MQYVIDTRDILAVGREFDLTKEQVSDMIDFVIKELTATVAENWKKVAQQSLHRTRQQYINSLYVGDEGKYTGFVQLRGSLPNMIEDGCDPFDMKVKMLTSSKAKRKKDGGLYFTVPFRWAVPTAEGDNSAFSGVLPVSVYNIIKKSPSSITGLGGVIVSGRALKIGELPQQFQIPKSRAPIITESKTFLEYKHKTSLLAGLVRSGKDYESTSSGKYATFRRISDLSDPLSWIHRGFQAKRLAERAIEMTDINMEVNRNTDRFLQDL